MCSCCGRALQQWVVRKGALFRRSVAVKVCPRCDLIKK